MIKEIVEAINTRDDFVLVAHTAPDGDTLGSTCALYGALKAMGKRVEMVCDSPVPDVYRFLPFISDMIEAANELPFVPKHIIAIDCADLGRLGALSPYFERAELTINIDHHITNKGFAHLSRISAEASSTGMLILELIKRLGIALDYDLALCIFVAISTDTGHFTYSNTTKETLLAAAELLDFELDIPNITNRLYRARSAIRTRLLGLALSRMELHNEGTVGVSYIAHEDFELLGNNTDTEGVVEIIRDIDTVDTALLFTERESGVIKVSMRSKRGFDVSAFAKRYGGGGHQRAAGFSAHGELHKIMGLVVKDVLFFL